MEKAVIISPSGKTAPVNPGSHVIKVSEPGSTVKISLPKAMVSGALKDGDNLILAKKNGEKIIVEDFFKTQGGQKNTLKIEDKGTVYEAKYSAEHFAGLSFTAVKQANDSDNESGETNTEAWLVPLLAIAAVGAGIAIYNIKDNGHSNSSHHDNNNKEKQTLDDARKKVNGEGNTLNKAQKQLEDAIKAMKSNPSPATIKAVEDARTAVKKATEALNKANSALQSAIYGAKAKGIDTKEAEKLHKKTNADIDDAKNALNKAADLVKIALSLTEEGAKALENKANEALKAAGDATKAASKHPTKQAIDTAKTKLETAKSAITALEKQMALLSQQIEKAKQLGFNVSPAQARLHDLQKKLAHMGKEAKALADAVAKAEKSLHELELANKAVEAATALMKKAAEQKAQAEKKLAEAQAMKDAALKNNQIDRIDEINKAIAEADKRLGEARKAADKANAAADNANKQIDNLNRDLDPGLKPPKVNPIDMKGLKPIDKGLKLDDNKSFSESIFNFIKNLSDSITTFWNTLSKSKPLEFLQKAISEVINGIKTLGDVFSTKVSALVDAVKSLAKGLGEIFINKPIGFIKDLMKITWDKTKEAVGEMFKMFKEGLDGVMSSLSKAVSDALKDMSLTDWVNPAKWTDLVKNIITGSIKSILKNLFDVIKTIPDKFMTFLSDALSKYSGAFSKVIADKIKILKETMSDVMKVLYEGFIKNPIDKIIKPLFEKVVDIFKHPGESLTKLVSDIVTLVKDSFGLIKDLINLPSKWINDSIQLIKDIINSFKGDHVKDGDGRELNKLLAKLNELAHNKHNSSQHELKQIFKENKSSGDINLNKLAPENGAPKLHIKPENHSSADHSNYKSPLPMDDLHTALPAAA
jgi:hypothetical protein